MQGAPPKGTGQWQFQLHSRIIWVRTTQAEHIWSKSQEQASLSLCSILLDHHALGAVTLRTEITHWRQPQSKKLHIHTYRGICIAPIYKDLMWEPRLHLTERLLTQVFQLLQCPIHVGRPISKLNVLKIGTRVVQEVPEARLAEYPWTQCRWGTSTSLQLDGLFLGLICLYLPEKRAENFHFLSIYFFKGRNSFKLSFIVLIFL